LSAAPARTLDQLLNEAALKLDEAGCQDSRTDARMLLAAALDCDTARLISRLRDVPEPAQAQRFETFIGERMSGKPVHRILGRREFFGREFVLNEAALEPRPDTEILVETVLSDWRNRQGQISFCEVGTGSGAICVTLLCEIANANATGTDISSRALECTKANADRLQMSGRLELVETDCLEDVSGPFDFIVSNPPYIPSGDIAGLDREVREHDPAIALDGGEDGLDFYRKLLAQAGSRLVAGGRLYLETGHDQHDRIADIAGSRGWKQVSALRDLAGQPRVMVFSI
jgi:release factor glutamine methyltransferase